VPHNIFYILLCNFLILLLLAGHYVLS
jgi:hypothetical protein